LDELESLLGVSFAPQDALEEDIETLGGLVTSLKGEVPQRGERISLQNGFDVEIVESDLRRITLLALKKV
jgi:magnesium and cobalt transporter